MSWTAATRQSSSASGTAWYKACMLKRGSIGSGPMSFAEREPVTFGPRELMDCAGVAKPRLGSMSSSAGKSLYIMSGLRRKIELRQGTNRDTLNYLR